MNKVTPGMVEAGVNVLARAKRTPQEDSSVVALIYNAMDAIRRQEEAARREPGRTPAYVHQAFPSYRFDPVTGESRLCTTAADVPEGWLESPPAEEVHALERDAHILPVDKRSLSLIKAREARAQKRAEAQT